MRFARDNSLSIFFLVIFLASLAGQAIAGHGAFNVFMAPTVITSGSLPGEVIVA